MPHNVGLGLKAYGNYPLCFFQEKLFTFPTKNNWWEKSDLELIKKSMRIIAKKMIAHKIEKLYIPKPGKGNTVMNTKLKNVADGRVLERTFQVGFKLEDVRVERRPYQYLYEDATGCIFMNQETFEQVPIAKENVTGGQYMKEGDVVEVITDTTDGTILLAEMPVKTTLKITHSEPGVKGNTATNATKPATLETGAEVRVPLFVNEGETIQIDTRDGSYLGRVSE
jgi:elongation factor P